MPAIDPKVMQATSNLHDQIRGTRCRETEYLLDNPAPLHAGKDVFHHDTDPADNPIQPPLRHP